MGPNERPNGRSERKTEREIRTKDRTGDPNERPNGRSERESPSGREPGRARMRPSTAGVTPGWRRRGDREADMGVRALRAMAVIIGAVVIGVTAIAGCGVQTTSGLHVEPTAPASSAGTPGTVACVMPKLAGPSKTFRITEKD